MNKGNRKARSQSSMEKYRREKGLKQLVQLGPDAERP